MDSGLTTELSNSDTIFVGKTYHMVAKFGGLLGEVRSDLVLNVVGEGRDSRTSRQPDE